MTVINAIQADATLTSGTIHLMVAGDVNGTTAGATAVEKFAFDQGAVTSIIEGINITGDFLETEPMTMDSVRDDMLFGGRTEQSPADLRNAMSVLAPRPGGSGVARWCKCHPPLTGADRRTLI